MIDKLLSTADNALRTLSGASHPSRNSPAEAARDVPLDPADRRLSGALMRVNHVGEVCAQALYRAQALSTRDEQLREHLQHAAQEEIDHLAWCADRLRALNGRPSLLNPLWYGGAFAIGTVAGLVGDKVSLGFVIETERQVEAHLASHLERLPDGDHSSRAIVARMKEEEARHAEEARDRGGIDLPRPVRGLMRMAAKVMTRTAHHL